MSCKWATKETAESWTGNQHVALQTTLSTEVAHFTQDEENILHNGATCNISKTAAEPSIPVGSLRLKEGHIKIWTARVPTVRHTPDLVRLSTTCCYLLCLFVTEAKILNYSVVDTPEHSL